MHFKRNAHNLKHKPTPYAHQFDFRLKNRFFGLEWLLDILKLPYLLLIYACIQNSTLLNADINIHIYLRSDFGIKTIRSIQRFICFLFLNSKSDEFQLCVNKIQAERVSFILTLCILWLQRDFLRESIPNTKSLQLKRKVSKNVQKLQTSSFEKKNTSKQQLKDNNK